MKRAALGIFAGVRAFFGGMGFVVGTPGVWGWASIPVFVATLIFGAVFGASLYWSGDIVHRFVGAESPWGTVGEWILKVLLWLIGLLVAFIVSFALAQPLSGFALERIAQRQETALGGRTWPDQPFFPGLLRSLRVSLSALAVGLPIVLLLSLITLIFPPAGVVTVPLKFIVAGLTAAYDFLDYPFSIRGEGVRARLVFMKTEFWAVLGFGLTIAAILLIPGVGLLLLPFGVAGATRLVAERDRKLARSPG